MNDFPAYDGEIDNHTITNASGVDMLVFFDYACEQSEYDEYAAKLEAAGFEKHRHQAYRPYTRRPQQSV